MGRFWDGVPDVEQVLGGLRSHGYRVYGFRDACGKQAIRISMR
jgi:hypothetical protein